MTIRSRPNVLVRAFLALMPQDERFIERFSEHAGLIVPAAEAFRALMYRDGQAEQHAAEIASLEDAADQITRETVVAIHRTFVTPFDRSQILDLNTALDDTIDLMKDTGRWMIRYGVGFSTTHTITGFVVGVGSARRVSAVHRGAARSMVVA
jgi:predicted phosphate transport protein (TIGR00153 family)